MFQNSWLKPLRTWQYPGNYGGQQPIGSESSRFVETALEDAKLSELKDAAKHSLFEASMDSISLMDTGNARNSGLGSGFSTTSSDVDSRSWPDVVSKTTISLLSKRRRTSRALEVETAVLESRVETPKAAGRV